MVWCSTVRLPTPSKCKPSSDPAQGREVARVSPQSPRSQLHRLAFVPHTMLDKFFLLLNRLAFTPAPAPAPAAYMRGRCGEGIR